MVSAIIYILLLQIIYLYDIIFTYTVQNSILGTGYGWPPFFAPAIHHRGYYYAIKLDVELQCNHILPGLGPDDAICRTTGTFTVRLVPFRGGHHQRSKALIKLSGVVSTAA